MKFYLDQASYKDNGNVSPGYVKAFNAKPESPIPTDPDMRYYGDTRYIVDVPDLETLILLAHGIEEDLIITRANKQLGEELPTIIIYDDYME